MTSLVHQNLEKLHQQGQEQLELQRKQNRNMNIAAVANTMISAEIARTNRQVVAKLDESLELQNAANEIAIHTNQLVQQTNESLKDITYELERIGHGMAMLDQSIQGVETAIRDQTEMHKKQYDAIEKEKALKEIIYNMTKFQKKLENTEEKLSKGYGARKLTEILKASNFSTKDLSSIQDKEYYDSLLDKCAEIWSSLSDDEKEIFDDIEKLIYTVGELQSIDIHSYVREKYPDKEYLELDIDGDHIAKPSKPFVEMSEELIKIQNEFGSNELKLRKLTVQKKQKKQGRYRKIAIYSMVGSILTGIGNAIVGPAEPASVIAFLSFMVSVSATAGYIFLKISLAASKFFLRKVERYDELRKSYELEVKTAEQKYQSELAEYEAKIEKYESDELAELEKQNLEIEAENEKLASKREQLTVLHNDLIIEYTNSVNNFLKANEPMQQFLPLLPEPAGA